MSLSTIIENTIPVSVKGINFSLGREHPTICTFQLNTASCLFGSQLLYNSKECVRVMPRKCLLCILKLQHQLSLTQALASASQRLACTLKTHILSPKIPHTAGGSVPNAQKSNANLFGQS